MKILAVFSVLTIAAIIAPANAQSQGIRHTPKSPLAPTAPGQNGDPRSPPKVPDLKKGGGPVKDAPNPYIGKGSGGTVDKYKGNGGTSNNPYIGSGGTVDKYKGNGGTQNYPYIGGVTNDKYRKLSLCA